MGVSGLLPTGWSGEGKKDALPLSSGFLSVKGVAVTV